MKPNKEKLFQAIFASIAKGGGTFTPEGNEYKKDYGYLVAQETDSEIIPTPLKQTLTEITNYVRGWLNNLFPDESETTIEALGSWVTEDKIYLDIVHHIHDEEVAVSYAVRQNQVAFWDCKNSVAVPVSLDDKNVVRNILLLNVIRHAQYLTREAVTNMTAQVQSIALTQKRTHLSNIEQVEIAFVEFLNLTGYVGT